MKATGIVRRIDDLGRVVVPKEIRRTLRIREGDPLEIFTDREGEIILKKYSPIGELSQFAGQEGFGFEGITVALIGGSNPIGCIFSGLFYGAMKYGGSKLSIVKAPSEVVDIIMGCVVLLIAIAHVFKYFVLKTAKKKEAK